MSARPFSCEEVSYFGGDCIVNEADGCLCDPPIDFFSGYVTHPSEVTRPYASFSKNPGKYGNTFNRPGSNREMDSDDDDLVNLPADFSSRPPVVNSWNGWDPLEEVIVGTIQDGRLFALDESFEITDIFKEELKYYGLSPFSGNGIVDRKYFDEAKRCQDNLEKLLKNENIIVRRPEKIPFDKNIKTPLWDCDHTNSVSCPRDVLITLGNTIVEAPVAQRCRYYEHLAYRTLLNEYFHRDPHFRWIEAPKPTMTKVMSRSNFDWKNLSKIEDTIITGDCLLTEHEPAFDAASIMRMGKDLFVLRDVRTNLSAMTWLQRTFKDEFRVHTIFKPSDSLPWHVDTSMLCLRQPEEGRPGIILINEDHPVDDCYKKLFEPDWTWITAPRPNHERSPPYCDASTWLSLNVLLTDPKTIVVEQTEKNLIEMCESYGMRVLQVDYRGAYFTGGAIHCGTVDIRRRGTQKDYLPTLTRRIDEKQKKQQKKHSQYLSSKSDQD